MSSVGITLIHISGRGAVSHEVAESSDEGSGSHVHVANYVQRDAVKCDNNREEAKISGQLQKIFSMS